MTATRHARLVRAPNPSPQTLDGTNTWLLAGTGATEVAVVDPGPADPGHLRAIEANAAAAGQRVTHILLTHTHLDHSEAAATLSERTGAPVHAADPARVPGLAEGQTLAPSQVLEVAGLDIWVIPTPGHTTDSVCFHIPADQALLTGDTILGRGTTVLAENGDLADYLSTLGKLAALAAAAPVTTLLPGHGPVITDPLATITGYQAHRHQRLSQIITAIANGAETPDELIAAVYPGLDPALHDFATYQVRAQLAYLQRLGDLPASPKT